MARASLPQAKLLLHLWLDGPKPHILGLNSTWDAVVVRNWVCTTGEKKLLPSGVSAPYYRITEAGWDAARNALAEVHVRG